jgi:hypothetical protein
MTFAVPPWMAKNAPGAAEAARAIARGHLTEPQRRRLERLIADNTARAWLEPLRRRRTKDKPGLTQEAMRAAHFEMMFKAFSAAEHPPIGRKKIKDIKEGLLTAASNLSQLARIIIVMSSYPQLAGMWSTYLLNRSDNPLLRGLPKDLELMGQVQEEIAGFFNAAGAHYKPEGPVPPAGRPGSKDALKTAVIRQLASVCEKHFGTPLYSTVATLVNASLGCDDIDRVSVRASLRAQRPRIVA